MAAIKKTNPAKFVDVDVMFFLIFFFLFPSGLLRLQELYQRIKPGINSGGGPLIETVRRVDSGKEAIGHLQILESLDRFFFFFLFST